MYEFIEDLTSDVMFVAEAPDLASLLEESARALFDVVCNRKAVEPKENVRIVVEAETPEKLLYEWLSRLLTESDSNELFFSEFQVSVSEQDGKLVARGEALGEPYSQEKSGTVVKGITLYGFEVEKTEKGYRARVACDI